MLADIDPPDMSFLLPYPFAFVTPAVRGRGYGRQLYMDVLDHASREGHRLVVCEVNADPPNPISDAFHAALGFVVVGSETIQGSNKTVRYFCRDIGAGD